MRAVQLAGVGLIIWWFASSSGLVQAQFTNNVERAGPLTVRQAARLGAKRCALRVCMVGIQPELGNLWSIGLLGIQPNK